MAVVLPPINEVIDLRSIHLSMARRHLPIPIMTVAAISVGMMGFGNGRIGRRFSVLDAVYGVVRVAVLWMTIDLDYPGIGIIGVSNLPLVETLAAMNWVWLLGTSGRLKTSWRSTEKSAVPGRSVRGKTAWMFGGTQIPRIFASPRRVDTSRPFLSAY